MNQSTFQSSAYFHLLPSNQLKDCHVSVSSLWTDTVWRLDKSTPGFYGKRANINWNIASPQGFSLLDQESMVLLDHLRRFVWSLLIDPRYHESLKTSSLSSVGRMIAFLVEWMYINDYRSISELDNTASWEYVEYVQICAHRQNASFNKKWIWPRLHILTLLYKQAPALHSAGIELLTEPPFDGRSPFAVAKDISRNVPYLIPPLPDTIALPIMAVAERMIGQPALDVIELQKWYLRNYANSGSVSRQESACMEPCEFEFSILPGKSEPWRKKINRFLQTPDEIESELLQLILDIRSACIIVLRSHAGLRINEILGLQGDADPETGLPYCIEIRTSRTGLNKHFYLRGATSTKQKSPMKWMIGACPVESEDYPPPVQALTMLEQLFRPWRELGELDYLIVSFNTWLNLPKTANSIIKPFINASNPEQTAFIHRHVTSDNVADNTELDRYLIGPGLRTHQWRKTFALYLFRIDERMLSATKRHFKDLSFAMGEQQGISDDWQKVDAFFNVNQYLTIRFLYETAIGQAKFAGKLSTYMEKYRNGFRKNGLSPKEIYQLIENTVIDDDVRFWFAEYGNCFIHIEPDQARCHQLAGTINETCPIPYFEYREPSICLNCNCFLINSEHAEFWRHRYRQNRTAALSAEGIGRRGEFYVARQRAEQSAEVLRDLGIDVPEIHHES